MGMERGPPAAGSISRRRLAMCTRGRRPLAARLPCPAVVPPNRPLRLPLPAHLARSPRDRLRARARRGGGHPGAGRPRGALGLARARAPALHALARLHVAGSHCVWRRHVGVMPARFRRCGVPRAGPATRSAARAHRDQRATVVSPRAPAASRTAKDPGTSRLHDSSLPSACCGLSSSLLSSASIGAESYAAPGRAIRLAPINSSAPCPHARRTHKVPTRYRRMHKRADRRGSLQDPASNGVQALRLYATGAATCADCHGKEGGRRFESGRGLQKPRYSAVFLFSEWLW
jgi:hypothetical protein